MKITELRFEKKLSDGNYGSEGISITGSDAGLDPIVEIPKLKLLVEYALHGDAWAKRYEQAMRIVSGEVMADGDSEEEARKYAINYDAWFARVQAARAELK